LIYYAIMAARQTVQYTYKHANTSTRKTYKDKKTVTNKAINRQTRLAAVGRRSGR